MESQKRLPQSSVAGESSIVAARDGHAETGVERIVGGARRELPAGRNRVERISAHGKGLVSDLTSWAELKMKLVQVEIEEKIDERLNQIVGNAIVAGIGLVGVLFLLTAVGMGVSALLIAAGLSSPLSYFLGFLFVAILLFVVAAILKSMRPHLVDVGSKEAHVDQEKLTPGISPEV